MRPVVLTLPSTLFPFRQSDLACFDYQDYRLQNVFGSITPSQQQQCVAMWLGAGVAHSPKRAWQRSEQACYLLYERLSGRLIGVNTLYVATSPLDGGRYYFNRMFILPNYRKSRLMIVGTTAMLAFANSVLADEGPPGIININENPKLARVGMRRIFTRIGYRLLGQHDRQDVWYFEFAQARLVDRRD
jgi:hypothetical protein